MLPVLAPVAGVILEVAVTVLGTLFSAGPAPGGPQPPFHLAQLDGSEGSGAALEDWMQASVSPWHVDLLDDYSSRCGN